MLAFALASQAGAQPAPARQRQERCPERKRECHRAISGFSSTPHTSVTTAGTRSTTWTPNSTRNSTRGTSAAEADGDTGERRDQKRATQILALAEVEKLIEGWPASPLHAARQTMEQYGPPNEGTNFRLVWYFNGPWKPTEVTRDEIVHNFPTTHTDFITNWIDYRVPPEMFDQIGNFDGSCLLDRTAGEAGARCDTEAANTVTLNLMHEIVTGRRSVEEARHAFAEAISAYTLGRSSPYAEGLLFDPPAGDTTDPDEALLAPDMANRMAQKAMDMVAGEPHDSKHFWLGRSRSEPFARPEGAVGTEMIAAPPCWPPMLRRTSREKGG